MIAFARAATVESASRGGSPEGHHRSADGHGRSPAAAPTPPPPADGLARQRRAEQLGNGIARLGAHLDAAMYRQLVMIREFDELEGLHLEGFRSCAQWLSWRIRLAPGAARERLSRV